MQPYDQEINELIEKYEGAWRSGYAAFPSLVHRLGLRRGVEVGVAFGGHAGSILERGGVDKLTGVDRYRHQPDYDDPMNLSQPMFDRLAQRVVDRLKPFGQRFELIREDSEGASSRFDDESLDFVYLDADHSEPGVTSDLCHWASKVRPGGIIAGHDYGHRDFPGVKRAVDRYFARFGWQVQELGNGVWWVERQALPISFFSPCYNCADWIQSTAMSVIRDNLGPGDEYILVNDGSKDDTAKILNQLASEHDQVRVVSHGTNQGGGAARNTAVGYAEHRLLFCLDSDNRLPTGLADDFRKHLLTTEAEVMVPETIRFFDNEAAAEDDQLIESHHATYEPGQANFADYLSKPHAPASGGNLLFTRDAYNRASGFPNDAGALDAWGFGLRLAGTDARIQVMPGTFYWHRCGHDSYWTRHKRQGTMGLAATELIQPFIHRVHPKDRAYILGQGREKWYFERGKRRLRTADERKRVEKPKTRSLLKRLKQIRGGSGYNPASLRLVLGLGRSGTSWTLKVLSQCDGDLRAYGEPLHHLRPKLSISDSPDRVACNFANDLPQSHPLIRAYRQLSGQRVLKLDESAGALLRDTDRPGEVLIKEVHALLATPAVLNATGAKAVVITRDPMRVADSIFDCQGLESPYLHHEFDACGDSRLLAYIGTPEQTTRRLSLWQDIKNMNDPDERRVQSTVWAAAITQAVLEETARQLPEQVMTIAYEQASDDPQAVFAQAADHLGLTFGQKAQAFVETTQSRDESQDPYSIFRAREGKKAWRVLTEAQRERALERLIAGELLAGPDQMTSETCIKRSA